MYNILIVIFLGLSSYALRASYRDKKQGISHTAKIFLLGFSPSSAWMFIKIIQVGYQSEYFSLLFFLLIFHIFCLFALIVIGWFVKPKAQEVCPPLSCDEGAD